MHLDTYTVFHSFYQYNLEDIHTSNHPIVSDTWLRSDTVETDKTVYQC